MIYNTGTAELRVVRSSVSECGQNLQSRCNSQLEARFHVKMLGYIRRIGKGFIDPYTLCTLFKHLLGLTLTMPEMFGVHTTLFILIGLRLYKGRLQSLRFGFWIDALTQCS
jgi:hypothetical protein